MSDCAVVRFEGVGQPLVLAEGGELVPLIDRVLAAWPHQTRTADAATLGGRAEKLTLVREHGLYLLDSPWLESPIRHRDPVHTVCGLVVHLVHAFVASNPTALCLHSAAACLGGRLVVFPNVYRGGKSLLVAHLALLGVRSFGDDVIPVRGRFDSGFALGIAPRLRLPLPDCVTPDFAEFIAAHAGPGTGRYQYLDLDLEALAGHGESAPIGAFVVLDHRQGRAAALEPLAAGEMLRRVIARNFARAQPARRILQRLERLVRSRPCYRLGYDDPATAARLLAVRFGSWPEDRPRPPQTGKAAPAAVRPRRAAAGALKRAPQVIERRVGDDLFLVNVDTDSIFHLNELADALWGLAKAGTEEAEMIALVQAAFPDVPGERIATDVGRLLKSLVGKGLIARGGRERSGAIRDRAAQS
ncbi:MAG: PqqD family protein [Alphaproteobacteria bacterium]|nr:PqqD family protein [Alphaproteobacteria bacterium]